jgi:hypothetical protein
MKHLEFAHTRKSGGYKTILTRKIYWEALMSFWKSGSLWIC